MTWLTTLTVFEWSILFTRMLYLPLLLLAIRVTETPSPENRRLHLKATMHHIVSF
jgi:hypothetical protein